MQGGPPQPVPSDTGPVRKVPTPDPKLPPAPGPPVQAPTPTGPPVLGPAGPPAKTPAPAKPKPPPVRSRKHGKGTAAPKGKPVTEWATVEGFDPAKAWVGQEVFVWDGRRAGDGKAWLLTVTAVTAVPGGGKKVTFVSFDEVNAGKRAPAGNVYTVTHPHKMDDPEHERLQSVVAPIQEPAGMREKIPPLKNRTDPGWGIVLGLLARIGRSGSRGEQPAR